MMTQSLFGTVRRRESSCAIVSAADGLERFECGTYMQIMNKLQMAARIRANTILEPIQSVNITHGWIRTDNNKATPANLSVSGAGSPRMNVALGGIAPLSCVSVRPRTS